MLQLRTVRASALCRGLSHVRFQGPSLSNRADLAVCPLVSSPHQCIMAGRSDLSLKLADQWAYLSRAIDNMGRSSIHAVVAKDGVNRARLNPSRHSICVLRDRTRIKPLDV